MLVLRFPHLRAPLADFQTESAVRLTVPGALI